MDERIFYKNWANVASALEETSHPINLTGKDWIFKRSQISIENISIFFDMPAQMFMGEHLQSTIVLRNQGINATEIQLSCDQNNEVQVEFIACEKPIHSQGQRLTVQLKTNTELSQQIRIHPLKTGKVLIKVKYSIDHQEKEVAKEIQILPNGIHVQQHFSKLETVQALSNNLNVVSLDTFQLLLPAINEHRFKMMIRKQDIHVTISGNQFGNIFSDNKNTIAKSSIKSRLGLHRLLQFDSDVEMLQELLIQQRFLGTKFIPKASLERWKRSVLLQMQQLLVHRSTEGWFFQCLTQNDKEAQNYYKPNLVLTASIIRSFVQLRLDIENETTFDKVFNLDMKMLHKSVQWLLQQQQFHGQFQEYSEDLSQATIRSAHPNGVLTMTATVLMAFSAVQRLLQQQLRQLSFFREEELKRQKPIAVAPIWTDTTVDPYREAQQSARKLLQRLQPAIERSLHYLKSGLDLQNLQVRYSSTFSLLELFKSMENSEEDLLTITQAICEQDRKSGRFLVDALHEFVRIYSNGQSYFGTRTLAKSRYHLQRHQISELPPFTEPQESFIVINTARFLLCRLQLEKYSDNERFIKFLGSRKTGQQQWISLQATALAMRAIRLAKCGSLSPNQIEGCVPGLFYKKLELDGLLNSQIVSEQPVQLNKRILAQVSLKTPSYHPLNTSIRLELSGPVDPSFWINKRIAFPGQLIKGFESSSSDSNDLNMMLLTASGIGFYQIDVHFDLYLDQLIQPMLPYVYAFDLEVMIWPIVFPLLVDVRHREEINAEKNISQFVDYFDQKFGQNVEFRLRSCQKWTLLKQRPHCKYAVVQIQIPTGLEPIQSSFGTIVAETNKTAFLEYFHEQNLLLVHLEKITHEPNCIHIPLQQRHYVWNVSKNLLATIYEFSAPEHRTIALVNTEQLNGPSAPGSSRFNFCAKVDSIDLLSLQTITLVVNGITFVLILLLLFVLCRNLHFIAFRLKSRKRP